MNTITVVLSVLGVFYITGGNVRAQQPALDEKAPKKSEHKELTAEQKRQNEVAKTFAGILLRTESAWDWDKPDRDLELFAHYLPNYDIKITAWDNENKKFIRDKELVISGAEWRYAMTVLRSYGNSPRMSETERKMVMKEVFGMETRPERGTNEHRLGMAKLAGLTQLLGGEAMSRQILVVEDLRKDGQKKEEPKEPAKEAPKLSDEEYNKLLKEATELLAPGRTLPGPLPVVPTEKKNPFSPNGNKPPKSN